MDMFGKQVEKKDGENVVNIITKKHRFSKSLFVGLVFAIFFLCLIFIGKVVLPIVMESL